MFRIPIGQRFLLRLGSFLPVLLLLWSCDPGFGYRPRGWQTKEGYNYLWESTFSGVELRTSGIRGLIGDRNISPEFEIHNATDEPLILEMAELAIQAGRYSGDLPDGGALKWRTVEPGSTKRIPIGWDFEERPMDLLGSHPSLILTFRLGDEPHQVEITYERME